ncbi:hypothetical protein HOLleu_05865 [Holothuria leucospilota]|uniref:Uncharacterized protein n=1 Tax=Holothuria leucospilota TaxID=206669 RepID=A0A9Q1CM92_HOLLE|nr:hypothetical protein HOLleu_05865 [Holothuria leucospilota]
MDVIVPNYKRSSLVVIRKSKDEGSFQTPCGYYCPLIASKVKHRPTNQSYVTHEKCSLLLDAKLQTGNPH